MTDEPVDLDARRTAAGQMAADMRRHALKDFETAQEALRRRQEELEAQLMAEPAETWPEAALKAQYLIRLFARTAEAQDPNRRKLVERALGDIARLLIQEDDPR